MGKIKIKKTNILLYAIIALAAVQILSYSSAAWQQTTSGINTVLSQVASFNAPLVILRFIATTVIIATSFYYGRFSKWSIIILILFTGILSIHTVDTIIECGISEYLYLSDFPLMYLFILGFYAGKNEEIWDVSKKAIKILLPVYLIAFIYSFISSYSKFGWGIYSNSSVVAYYSQLFWLTVFYVVIKILDCYDNNAKFPKIAYLLIVVLLIGAVMIRSRSWIIQAVLLLILCVFMASKVQKSPLGKIKYLVIFITLFTIAFIICTEVFPLYYNALMNKGLEDTRSYQYQELLSQTATWKWITGTGTFGTYDSSLYGEYSFIDNDLLYMAFHFGAFTAIFYFGHYIYVIVSAIKNHKYLKTITTLIVAVVLMWVLSVCGLSIYNRVHGDLKSILMPILAGYFSFRIKEKK